MVILPLNYQSIHLFLCLAPMSKKEVKNQENEFAHCPVYDKMEATK